MKDRKSIQPTYDSRETGPRYNITTRVNGHVTSFRERIEDPFVRQLVRVGWRHVLIAALACRRPVVEVIIDGDPEVIEDVLELDANYLGSMGSSRRREFKSDLNRALGEVSP